MDAGLHSKMMAVYSLLAAQCRRVQARDAKSELFFRVGLHGAAGVLAQGGKLCTLGQCSGKCGQLVGRVVGPAGLALTHQGIQAGVNPAKQRQACRHGLDIGKALRLTRGRADEHIPQRVVTRHLGGRDSPGEKHAVGHVQGLRLLFQCRTLGTVADDEQHGIGQGGHCCDEFSGVFLFGQAAQA